MASSRPPLGAHVSIAGGLPTAIDRGIDLGCEALQIFVKNNSQWVGRPLPDEEVERFLTAWKGSPIGPVVAHASYLINLAADSRQTLDRSRLALADELDRCQRLGLDGLVLHPGAHVGAGRAAGIERVIDSLDAVFGRVARSPLLLLEITAGQGTVLGSDLAELARILDGSAHRERLGICLDTCHAFAAGYPLHETAGYDAFFSTVEATVGLAAVGVIHLNDSLGALGSRRDRHASIGRGEIGRALFARLLRDPALARIPMILETPRGEHAALHRADLALLRRLRRG